MQRVRLQHLREVQQAAALGAMTLAPDPEAFEVLPVVRP